MNYRYYNHDSGINVGLAAILSAIIVGLLECGAFYLAQERFYIHSSFTIIAIILGLLGLAAGIWLFSEQDGDSLFSVIILCIALVALVIYIIVLIGSSPVVQANQYYSFVEHRMKVIEDDATTSAFPNLLGENNDTSNLPLIGEPEAMKRAQTEMGRFPALGSQFKLNEDDLTSQNINNSLCYVVPLQPIGWYKWSKEEGNHGYFIVDRNNSNTQFVEESLYTTTNAPFGSNAKRILNSYMTKNGISGCVTDISPEIDDDNVFHYVATVYTIRGISGIREVKGIIELDGQTLDCQYYDLDSIPEYVDRVFPESFFTDYLSYYGLYKLGWWNSWTTEKEVQKATSGMDVIYIDGVCYYYTGWSSTNQESSNGIMMMNSRTGEIEYHKTYGISESRAQGVLEGLIAEKRYAASYPLLLQVAGNETYFSLMRDVSGNLVGYGFVSYKDYSKASVETSLIDAQTAYMSTLMKTNSASSFNESLTAMVNGHITAITNEVIDGNTFYYVKVDENDTIFQMRSNLDTSIVFAEPGDRIKIEYYDSGSKVETAINCKLW